MTTTRADLHQTKSKRQEDMTSNLVSQRHNSREIRDRPAPRRRCPKIYHASDNWDAEHVHVFEVSEDLIETDAEALLLDFFGRGSPLHFDGEEVAEECGGQVQRDAAKEEDEHRCPFYSLDDGPEEYFLA